MRKVFMCTVGLEREQGRRSALVLIPRPEKKNVKMFLKRNSHLFRVLHCRFSWLYYLVLPGG